MRKDAAAWDAAALSPPGPGVSPGVVLVPVHSSAASQNGAHQTAHPPSCKHCAVGRPALGLVPALPVMAERTCIVTASEAPRLGPFHKLDLTVCTPFLKEPVLRTSTAVTGALLMGRTATAACILLSNKQLSLSVLSTFRYHH